MLIIAGHNSCSILSAMLQNEEPVIEQSVDLGVRRAHYADDATHLGYRLRPFAVGIWTLPATQTTMMGVRLALSEGQNLALDY